MSKTLTFNGTSSQGMFLINEISRTLLPPLSIPSTKAPRRAGVIPHYTEIGERVIDVGITILADNEIELKSKIRSIAGWLYTTEDKILSFSDDPDVFINARLSESTDLSTIALTGEGTLSFIAHDPFYYSNIEFSLLMSGAERIYTNLGTVETFPIVRFMSHGTTTNLKIQNETTGKFLLIKTSPAWQLIISDHSKNIIYNDSTGGTRFFNELDISSDFFPLVKGDNRITYVNDQNIQTDIRLIYRERFI